MLNKYVLVSWIPGVTRASWGGNGAQICHSQTENVHRAYTKALTCETQEISEFGKELKDLNPDPQRPCKKSSIRHTPAKTEGSVGNAGSLASLIIKLQIHWETLSQKIKWSSNRGRHPTSATGLHTHTRMRTQRIVHTCAHAHARTHTHRENHWFIKTYKNTLGFHFSQKNAACTGLVFHRTA